MSRPNHPTDRPPAPSAATTGRTADRIELKSAQDLRHLIAVIEQMAALKPGERFYWRRIDGGVEHFPVAAEPAARHRQALSVVLTELLRCGEAYGLGDAGARLLRHHLRALADHNQGIANPLLEAASRAGEDSAVRWRRMPDRLAENEMIGTAAAAIYRRSQAGQTHAEAAADVAALCARLGLRMPSTARRGQDEAGASGPERTRCTGPRLLRAFYDLQKIRAVRGGIANSPRGARARFLALALDATACIADPRQATQVIEDQLRARLATIETP